MTDKKEGRTAKRVRPKPNEELDELNGEMLQSYNASERIRRRMEASIEAKANKRRSHEVPASAGLKRSFGGGS